MIPKKIDEIKITIRNVPSVVNEIYSNLEDIIMQASRHFVEQCIKFTMYRSLYELLSRRLALTTSSGHNIIQPCEIQTRAHNS